MEGRPGDEHHARIIGLYGFAKIVRLLEQQAQHESRKARHILDNIATEIATVADTLTRQKTMISTRLETETRTRFAPYRDEEAEATHFAFVTHLTWQMLDLIADYDDLICLVTPYRQTKIIDKNMYRDVEKLATHLRRLLAMPEQMQREYGGKR